MRSLRNRSPSKPPTRCARPRAFSIFTFIANLVSGSRSFSRSPECRRSASRIIFLVALVAAFSHGLQGGAADYYRNAYLYFVNQRSRGDFHSSAALRSEYEALAWRDRPWQKFLLAVYLNYTRQQEMISPA